MTFSTPQRNKELDTKENSSLAPIALFVYKRPEHTKKTVESLQKNNLALQSHLYIFCDGPKSEKDNAGVEQVRSYVRTINGFASVTIVEYNNNQGLSKSVIQGVTRMVNEFGKVIVVEDDLVSSPYFLQYMNDALNLYEKDARVISIHGYIYPTKQKLPETFFIRGADCWGWATWKRAWDIFESDGHKLQQSLVEQGLMREFDFDGQYPYSNMLQRQINGQNDSWAIRWYASAFLANGLTLYPGHSLIDNIGQDSSGTHKGKTDNFKTAVYNEKIDVQRIPIEEDKNARKTISLYFRRLRPSLFKRIISYIRK